MTTFTATYSAEDNKLRLYASERLDKSLYHRVRDIGFKYAPKQALFVTPKWTPAREDICIELAGEITAEETTLIERAEAKAERLDNLATKRASQANAFHAAANRIAERFQGGQPILVGHHSERGARKDQARIHSAMDNAVKATNAIQYWHWKAEGVERHANRKANTGVRGRRIKTLLAELRDRQRDINHAFICLKLWEKIKAETDQEKYSKLVKHYAGAQLQTGAAAPYYSGDSLWYQLDRETITATEVVEKCLSFHEQQANSVFTGRWINHILNRLAFERSELGEVARFEGELTAVILQAFAREHGAHKPKATKQGEEWGLMSSVALPLNIADSNELVLSVAQWGELMQASGYEVPAPKVRRKSTTVQAPLINPTLEEAQKLQAQWNKEAEKKHAEKILGSMIQREVKQIEQAVFSANNQGDYTPFNTIELDSNGHKIWSSYQGKSGSPACRIRAFNGGGSLYAPQAIIHLIDKPSKPLPIEWQEVG
jgi:hypothetical protein